MLQRIYGVSFPKKSQLTEYLTRLEEAKKRDHRKLGKDLDLFSIQEEGPGFPFFHPKGMVLRNLLEDYWRKEHVKNGYQEIKTPIILNKDLWIRSDIGITIRTTCILLKLMKWIMPLNP